MLCAVAFLGSSWRERREGGVGRGGEGRGRGGRKGEGRGGGREGKREGGREGGMEGDYFTHNDIIQCINDVIQITDRVLVGQHPNQVQYKG